MRSLHPVTVWSNWPHQLTVRVHDGDVPFVARMASTTVIVRPGRGIRFEAEVEDPATLGGSYYDSRVADLDGRNPIPHSTLSILEVRHLLRIVSAAVDYLIAGAELPELLDWPQELEQ